MVAWPCIFKKSLYYTKCQKSSVYRDLLAFRVVQTLQDTFSLFFRAYSNERGIKATHKRNSMFQTYQATIRLKEKVSLPMEFETKSRQSFSKSLSQKDGECYLA